MAPLSVAFYPLANDMDQCTGNFMPSTLATLRAFLERLQSPDCLSAAVELLKSMLQGYPQLASGYQVCLLLFPLILAAILTIILAATLPLYA